MNRSANKLSSENTNPYKGLHLHKEDDKEVFYGREKETRDIFKSVKRNGLTLFLEKKGLVKNYFLTPVCSHC
jgi:hypothetical protein